MGSFAEVYLLIQVELVELNLQRVVEIPVCYQLIFLH